MKGIILLACISFLLFTPLFAQDEIALVPYPVSVKKSEGKYKLPQKITVSLDIPDHEQDALFSYLRKELGELYGIEATLVSRKENANLKFQLKRMPTGGKPAYELFVDGSGVRINANFSESAFHGLQTFFQLIPTGDNDRSLPFVQIFDHPRFGYRGMHLDVGRHFFPVSFVKKYIDYLARHKFNRFHWHLTEDQGWRIEIKSWPNLTAIGGKSQVGGGKGGFYTQEQYKDIVAYAQSRFITIVPEIDLPGHINAALVSYPDELLPATTIKLEPGQKRPVAGQPHIGTEVGFSTLSLKKESTFKFVNDVIREIAAITPGPYFHVGGDEAQVTKKEDYIEFVNRFKEIVNANGKIMIGWEEIAQADLDSTAIAQFWHSREYAKMAAEKGAKIIFSPSTKVYLDMQYDSTSRIGLNWAAYIEVDSSYRWDPAKLVPGIEREQIIGVEAPLWTETALNMDDIEYLAFPRLAGVAEIGWTPSSSRNWDDYKVRLANHAKPWKAMGIDFYRSPKVEWADEAKPQ